MIVSSPIKHQKFGELKYDDDEPLQEIKEFAKSQTNIENIEQEIVLKATPMQHIFQLGSKLPKNFPVMISVQTPPISFDSRPPIDLILAIDHSGSMAGKAMKLVKESFESLISILSPNDRLALVIFDDTAKRLSPLVKMTEENKQFLLDKMKKVYPDGGTDIHLALYHAFNLIKQRRYANTITSVFLLSDGLDQGAESKVQKTLQEMNIKDTFTIHTFGVGKENDPKLMRALSDIKDGNFYFMNKPDDIDSCFIDCLGGLLSTIGSDAKIHVDICESQAFGKGVVIAKTYGDANTWERNEKTDSATAKISQLVSGQSKDFVLELEFPETQNKVDDENKLTNLLKICCKFETLQGKPVEKEVLLSILCLNSDEEEQKDNDEKSVVLNHWRVRTAESLKSAAIMADQNDNIDAQKMLRVFKDELLDSKYKDEEVVKDLIFDLDQAILDLEPRRFMKKGRHYLEANSKAHMEQRSNFVSKANYANAYQQNMVQQYYQAKPKSRKYGRYKEHYQSDSDEEFNDFGEEE